MVRWADQFKRRMASKSKSASSRYQQGLYFSITGVQLLSSIVVLGIMLYFVSKLRGSHMHVPWIFIVNLTASLISTTSLAVLLLLYHSTIPARKENIILNSIILGLWIVSFGVLTNSMKSTISSSCSTKSWGNATGVMVCRLYKTVFSFEIIALATTLIGLVFSMSTRSSTAPGAYIRTPNPKFDGLQETDEDSEYRGLAQRTPSIAPSSATLYSNAFISPDALDDRSLGFPKAPGLSDAGEDAELTHLPPSRSSSEQIGDGNRY